MINSGVAQLKMTAPVMYFVYDDNLEDLKQWITDRGQDPDKMLKVHQDEMHDSLRDAKYWFEDALRGDQVHGEMDFETYGTEEDVYTKEGHFKLSADIDWNRHDKMYYFIEGISISDDRYRDGVPQPPTRVFVGGKILNKITKPIVICNGDNFIALSNKQFNNDYNVI